MGFAEATLGTLAGFANTDPTVAAIFAMVSLGMVLLALVAMYFREPAFLTFTSQQALDLRMVQELRDNPSLQNVYLNNVSLGEIVSGPTSGIADFPESSANEIAELDNELGAMGSSQ